MADPMTRNEAARETVKRALDEHFNSSAMLVLLRAYLVAKEAGRTALFLAMADRLTDRPSLFAPKPGEVA